MTTYVKKPQTGWAPGQRPQTPRPPEAPPSRTGGSGMPGVPIGHDVKHSAATAYQFGTGPGAGSRPKTGDPAYVSHQSRQVDQGRRVAPTKPKGKTRGA
jgi:hypothetical protein